MNRRLFLRLSTTGLVVAGGGLLAACGSAITSPAPVEEPASSTPNPVMEGMSSMSGMPSNAASEYLTESRLPSKDFRPDIDIELVARPKYVRLGAGQPTLVWTYDGRLVSGTSDALQSFGDGYLGPIIRARKGQTVRVNFTNDLPPGQESVIHWHGLHLPEDMDGHPRYAIGPGVSYAYEFEVIDNARTAWFHPHPHGKTALQIYNGMAGLFIVSDDEEATLGLPGGEFDVPIVIQDRTFDKNNQLAYFGQGIMAGQMEMLMGFLGEKILVNGRPDFVLSAKPTAYRLRVVNASNARIYKLAWGDKTPVTVIGTDGGLLESAIDMPYVMLAPGERIEMWADFSARKVGDEITMESLEFFGAEDPEAEMKARGNNGGGMDMGSMNMGDGRQGDANALGAPMPLFIVRIAPQGGQPAQRPASLARMQRYALDEAINADKPRIFELKQVDAKWKINGREFEMDSVAEDETVKLNTTEVWEIVNAANMSEPMHKLGMAHPFHVHGRQFQVLERTLALPELMPGYDSVREGLVDGGWKDTVMLMPGEWVRLLMKFTDYPGTFVYHCHNLEHEDIGMMRNYKIFG